ncbi:TPA: hypothetical protein ACKP9S_003579 [Pseudomonas aeruginosa]
MNLQRLAPVVLLYAMAFQLIMGGIIYAFLPELSLSRESLVGLLSFSMLAGAAAGYASTRPKRSR